MVDLELAYRVMAQPDALDPDAALFTAPASVDLSPPAGGKKKLIGIYKTWFDRADAEVQKLCWKALDYLTTHHGYEIIDITIPLIHDGQLAHAMTILSELGSGVPDSDLSKLTAPTKVLIAVGKKTPAIDFLQAQKLRNLLMQHLSHLYQEHPGLIIVTPTTPNAGWRINEADLKYGCSNGNQQVRNMEFAWMANFVGCPALSAPVGFVDAEDGRDGKIPVGIMGMSEWCAEDDLIRFGYEVEKWLHEGLEGGRPSPQGWVDVLELAEKGARA